MRLIAQLLKLNRACVAVFLARWDEQRPACRMSTDKHGYLTLQSAWVPELCYFVIAHTEWVPVRDCLLKEQEHVHVHVHVCACACACS